MTTSTVAPEIVSFAHAVRQALSDLPTDEVDDLTEGLEADLAESLAEDLRRTLPDPVAYAAELRLAAGLPEPTIQMSRGSRARLADTWRVAREGITATINRNPVLQSAADLADALRPLWWAGRAWLATWLLAAFFGMERGYWFDGAWWLVFAGLTVVSAQWGRGRWQFSGVSGVVLAGNVIAVIALLPVLNAAQSSGPSYGDYDAGFEAGSDSAGGAPGTDVPGEGLSMDGQPLENVYAYDAAGNKLTGVQLFDVDGKPLLPYRNVDDTSILQTPVTLESGVQVYNVYPLAITRMTYDDNGELVPEPNPDPEKARAYAEGPFLKVPAVQAPQPVAQPNE